jgi:hypothetical protein
MSGNPIRTVGILGVGRVGTAHNVRKARTAAPTFLRSSCLSAADDVRCRRLNGPWSLRSGGAQLARAHNDEYLESARGYHPLPSILVGRVKAKHAPRGEL